MRNFGFKTDNTAPSVGGILTAGEDNVRFSELGTACSSTGITLDPAIGPDTRLNMLAEALSRSTSGGVWGATTGGTSTAYTAGLTGSFQAPLALFDGLEAQVRPHVTNGVTPTFAWCGLTAKPIVDVAGLAPPTSSFVATRDIVLRYSPTLVAGGAWVLMPWTFAPRGQQAYTTAGSFTFTVPAGIFRLRARVWGGGGGGGAASGAANSFAGPGGGGGGYADKWIDVTPGQTVTVTIGAAGAVGVGAAQAGNGGTSSFGAFCSATGGVGGTRGLMGTSGFATAGGTGTGGDYNASGGYGEGTQNPTAGSVGIGGAGGGSFAGAPKGISSSGTNFDGLWPGGGGNGAGGTGSANGGAGAAGGAIIDW